MYCYCKVFILWIFIVLLIKLSKTTLSLTSKPSKTIFKLYDYNNNSCINKFLIQKYVIFNSDTNQNITAKLGNLQALWTTNENMKFFASIYTERRAYLVPSNSNEIVINAICQFSYDDERLPYLDDSFCCRIELEQANESIENPYAYCELNIVPKPAYCFVPVKVKVSTFLHNKVLQLIGTVYRKKQGRCNYRPNKTVIYVIAPPLTISFTNKLPVIWKLSSSYLWKILLGVPLYSASMGENLLIPVRMISDRADLSKRVINVQCFFDHIIYLNSVIPHYPSVILINNFTYNDENGYLINMKLKITPRRDHQLMFLNVTITPDSRQSDAINSAKLQCCSHSVDNVKVKRFVCEESRIVEIPLKQSYGITIIPAVNDSLDMFYLYSMPNVRFSKSVISVYGITNYKDKTVKDMTVQVSVYPFDSKYLTVPTANKNVNDIEMSYQTFLNPWSLQLEFYNTIHTILSPIRMWRPNDWKLVLSDDVLQPIKNWAVPESLSNNPICASRYKVARLKIYCRLYLVEETGETKYIGREDENADQIPYVDVTSKTSLSQLKMTTVDIISIQKSVNNDYFLVSAKQVGQSLDINLTPEDSNDLLATTRVSVDLLEIYVTDLIIHCIDALALANQNRTLKSIHKPNDHILITVTLNSNSISKPCYLVIFVVFSDKSVERISSVNHNLYRLMVTRSESEGVIDTPVSDNQLVIFRQWPRVNISLYEPLLCRDARLIFTKGIEWLAVEPINNIVQMTMPSTSFYETTKMNKTRPKLFNAFQSPIINPVHISIYICTGVVAFCFISFILYKLFCFRSRSHNNGNSLNNYQRSGSEYLEEPNIKVPIRTSNSKNFSSFSTNCLRQNTNKTQNNEPYPPLLPPPGPIAANYDLTIVDPICNDSAIDSGVEIGKLSSYSSNTCPSNDICCTMDLYPSCSGTDDSLMHQQYQSPQISNPMMAFYSPKGTIDSENQFHDSLMLSSLNSAKTISNLRHSYW